MKLKPQNPPSLEPQQVLPLQRYPTQSPEAFQASHLIAFASCSIISIILHDFASFASLFHNLHILHHFASFASFPSFCMILHHFHHFCIISIICIFCRILQDFASFASFGSLWTQKNGVPSSSDLHNLGPISASIASLSHIESQI